MLIAVTLPQCQLFIAVTLPVRWSMPLSLTFGQYCYSARRVVNAVIFHVSCSLLLPFLSGS
jgi:hypothetical protein